LADLFIRGPRYKSAALITIGCCHAVCHGLAGLADADDGGEPGAPGGFHLLPDQRVALAMIGAPLGMADDDRAGAGIRQHFGGDIAGMGAGVLGWQSWAPTASFEPRALSAKAAISVAGGQTRRSAFPASAPAPASMASNSAMEDFRPFILQLPAISGRMASVMSDSHQEP
jgi:hypothetical protein